MRCALARASDHGSVRPVREPLILAIHLLVTFAKLLRPGSVRAVAAESLLLEHQLLITNRSRQRGPNLTTLDRVVLGLATLLVSPRRTAKLGTLIKPAALLKFHKTLLGGSGTFVQKVTLMKRLKFSVLRDTYSLSP